MANETAVAAAAAQMEKMLEGPAALPPLGVHQHVTNTSDMQIWFDICIGICISIAGLFTLMRLYTKLVILRMTDLSDCK